MRAFRRADSLGEWLLAKCDRERARHIVERELLEAQKPEMDQAERDSLRRSG